ncbi:MAG: AAA family ATPase, partial [Fusobacteriaceae bacterium]|nr:AAA family ATPase [Fusobacteriaceae bacterium]
MKIRNISINEYKVFKNFAVDFSFMGETLDLIVLAGSNGSGKTTLLQFIYEYFRNESYMYESTQKNITISLEPSEEKAKEELQSLREWLSSPNFFQNLYLFQQLKDNPVGKRQFLILHNILPVLPKIIYVPTKVNFSDVQSNSNTLEKRYRFLNIIDTEFLSDVASYIATRINYVANTEDNLTGKQVREKVSEEINSIFDILELDIKMVGLSRDERNMPIFKNSFGNEFDINSLSSGEKQLFLRTLAISLLEPQNSILLIDEPEISLHPLWQQKILSVYRKIGKNNQIIVATHSPLIIGSVPKENIIILNKSVENRKIEIIYGKDGYGSLGQSVDRILEDIMGLESAR